VDLMFSCKKYMPLKKVSKNPEFKSDFGSEEEFGRIKSSAYFPEDLGLFLD
jgi:hypothetical protein